MKKEGKAVERKTEQCVLCGVDTGVLADIPADARRYYVTGIGQLCESCYRSLQYDRFNMSK